MTVTAQTIQETLRGVRFFDGIPEREQQRIASLGRLEEYKPEEVIFREGQRRGSVFVVADGSVALDIRVPEHGGRWFQTVTAGGLLGWSSVLDQPPLTATARALTVCRLVALDVNGLLALCESEPRFGFLFMRQVARAVVGRLNATRAQLLAAYGESLPVVAGIHEGAD
jgi:CRP-like cAMP-binding protein